MVDSGYAPGPGNGGGGGGSTPVPTRDHAELKKDYLAYLGGKREEIKEQQQSRRYVHGSQWTDKQIKALNRRNQPVVTFNRIGRKINAVIGLLEKQRQDPRGYPRTPQHEEGAEVATAVLRYVLDEQEWKAKSPVSAMDGAIDGIGGIELMLERGDKGDVEVGFETVDTGSFFYDPRSLKMDFSDARYMGVGKWADVEALVEQFPDKEAEIRSSVETGSELTSSPDSDVKWLTSEGSNSKRIRVIDHWYISKGEWHYCVYTGATMLGDGLSPYKDEKGKTTCKYLMFSANVDQDGDRYGFVRNMKSSQDEINQRRSKGLHVSSSRRIIVRDGQGLDVEKIRAEIVKPDGVIVIPPGAEIPQFDDVARANEMQAQLGLLAEAKQEIENYGFNPALMGTGVQDMSGRAIKLQQDAGIAELGPFLIAYRQWKLRVYRGIWNAVQEHWTAERWIRVTDDAKVAQFFAVNQLAVDPRTMQPTIVNQLGALDVDIILDEGPDQINMQADAYDTMVTMARNGQQFPPEVVIELSPLPSSVKEKLLGMIEKSKNAPPNPIQQIAAKLELQNKDLANKKIESEIAVNQSKAMTAAPADPTAGNALEWRKALLSSITSIIVAKIGAKTDQESAAFEAQIEGLMHLSGLQADAQAQLRDHAHQAALLALQPPPPPAAQPQAAA